MPLPLSVCIPTISTSQKSRPEDLMRKSTESSSHSSSMAKTTLVSVVTGDDNRPTNLSPTVQESTVKPIGDD